MMPMLIEPLTVSLGGDRGLSDPFPLTFMFNCQAEGCRPSFVAMVSCWRCLGGQGSMVLVEGTFIHSFLHLMAQVQNQRVISDPSLTPRCTWPTRFSVSTAAALV